MSSRSKTAYVVMSSIVVAGYLALAIVVSMKVASAEQLGLAVKLAVWALLWGFLGYAIWLLVRYYKNLNDSELG